MKLIVQSILSENYRQENNLWKRDIETARLFNPEDNFIIWCKHYPKYYRLIEQKED